MCAIYKLMNYVNIPHFCPLHVLTNANKIEKREMILKFPQLPPYYQTIRILFQFLTMTK
jgi:hypothetical protein